MEAKFSAPAGNKVMVMLLSLCSAGSARPRLSPQCTPPIPLSSSTHPLHSSTPSLCCLLHDLSGTKDFIPVLPLCLTFTTHPSYTQFHADSRTIVWCTSIIVWFTMQATCSHTVAVHFCRVSLHSAVKLTLSFSPLTYSVIPIESHQYTVCHV